MSIDIGDRIFWFPPGTKGSAELMVAGIQAGDVLAKVIKSDEVAKIPPPDHSVVFAQEELKAFPQCEGTWYSRAYL